MKKLFILFIALAVCVAIAPSAFAYTSDATDSVSVSAVIGASVLLDVVSDWAPDGIDTVGFGSVDSTLTDVTVSSNKQTITYASNYPAWAIWAYTDNKADLTASVVYNTATDDLGNATAVLDASYGGLVSDASSTSPRDRVGLAWNGQEDQTAAASTVVDPADANFGDNWTWLVDKTAVAWDGSDADSPTFIESTFDFEGSGYATILAGGAGNVNGSVMQGAFPAVDDGIIALYTAGAFEGKNPGTYGTTVHYDLVHF